MKFKYNYPSYILSNWIDEIKPLRGEKCWESSSLKSRGMFSGFNAKSI